MNQARWKTVAIKFSACHTKKTNPHIRNYNLLFSMWNSTCPSAIISKTWYWPPLCSTIVIAISMTGANDVGPIDIRKQFQKHIADEHHKSYNQDSGLNEPARRN